MNYIVKIEGQEIPVPEEIGRDDDSVKRALAPYFPDAANAMITRVEEGETVKITVVKRAGSKGNGHDDIVPQRVPQQYLVECEGGQNPVIVLFEELRQKDQAGMDIEALLSLDHEIAEAVEAGGKQYDAIASAYKRLRNARPQPAPVLVMGF